MKKDSKIIKKLKKKDKPWGQKEHDQFLKESGMTEEEHEEWHKEHGGWHGKNKDKAREN